MDGKPGHEKQSLSLVRALEVEIDIKVFNIKILNLLHCVLSLKEQLKKIPTPDLIIAAGHKTHMPLILIKLLFGGKSIVIMKPSLPCNWFNLCIIPAHDKYEKKGYVFRSKGALANTKNLYKKNQKKGLILIGGISNHYKWDSNKIISQIKELLKNNININYILSPSRRTPKDFIKKIRKLSYNNLQIHLIKNQEQEWLENHMNKSKYAWVSEDSISMIYESLTAGQVVGVLNLSGKKNSRIVKEVDRLKEENIIFSNKKRSYKNTLKFNNTFNEASRCAKFIVKSFLKRFKKNEK